MKGLLILLTSVAILGAVFSGGCSLLWVGSYLWHGPRGQYPDLQRGIAWISAGVGLLAVAVLAANLWVLRAVFGPHAPRRRLLAGVLASMDLATAGAAMAWLMWADTWRWAEWPWTWLAKAAACALAIKGVLIWRLVGRGLPGRPDSPASAPRSA
jgi:hypothetical protein